MIKVEFFKGGTNVFITSIYGILKVTVEDVLRDKEGNVSYLLRGGKETGSVRLHSSLVFESIESIKTHLDKQIEDLTPKKETEDEQKKDGPVS